MKIVQILLFFSLTSFAFSTVAAPVATENKEEKEKATLPAKTEKPKAISTGDKIYTWIDKSGNRIYSDVPREGAEVMKIEKGTDYTEPNTRRDWSTMKPKVVSGGKPYDHFEIVSPANDSTIRNNNGDFQIALDIRPKLDDRHAIKLEIDGKPRTTSGSSIIALQNIDRGSHTLIAYIVDVNGEVLATTAAVTVHLHRATVK